MTALARQPALARPGVRLDDKYDAVAGPVLLNGIQALVRIALDQRRLDARAGRRTGIFLSGYPGSPLGGVDRELLRERRRLDAAGVVFRAGLNEELAATAVAGTQLLGELERRRVDGVTGFWFGKSPGLDRAADAIRHGTLSGTAPLGGAVAWIGDDPASKSSTVPSSSEPLCRSLLLPLLAPGTVREQLELGLHAVALSRHAGLWSGLKIVADIADATAVVELDGLLDAIPTFEPRAAFRPPVLLPPSNLAAEHDLMTERLERAQEYARAAELNRIVFEPRRPRLALIGAGSSYQAIVRALDDLGLDSDGARERAGLRLVRLSMPWPLGRAELRRLAGGVETVLVVEDKLPFVEQLVRDALYREPDAPLVLGKQDGDGAPLLSSHSTLGADDVARALGRLLDADALGAAGRARLQLIEQRSVETGRLLPLPKRTPYFCSGCPHNVSTRADAEQLVGVGIGCHVMVALDADGRRGKLLGMPQMGGEGIQWLGLEPFTDDEHFVQNLGDGTFHHSGSLAVRAATAAGAHITYKLLYNDAVAMTGGQDPTGRMAVPQLTRWLALEGVRQVVITTPEPRSYRGVALDPIAQVRHRDELAEVERELARVDGVTVLIHDDRCATEKRRLRKRGTLPAPARRVWINERVCEGCGDCGEQSSCLSVLPVETEFGRKTRIDQSSCNQDFSCLKGDCPSFLTVVPASARGGTARAAGSGGAASGGAARVPQPPRALPEPLPRVGRDVLLRMPGVGGTGVVTVSAIVQMAAHLDGRFAAGLEQTGLAQKGGPVISDLRIGDGPIAGLVRASTGSADVLLGFDLLGAAAAETLAVADPERTVAVVNVAATPTAQMVTDPDAAFPALHGPRRRIERATRAQDALFLDSAHLAERLLGDHLPANMLLVGAAYQHGCLPLSAEAIEAAIELNGTAVAANLAAFRWGRAAVADPEAVERALAPSERKPGAPATDASATDASALTRLLDLRVRELTAYQDAAYARRYREAVEAVAAIERERTGGDAGVVAQAYARGLFKLLAYKDEYEVARLHLDPAERARREQELGAGATVKVMLHPPALRALGMRRKLAIGVGAGPLLHGLAGAKRLRGTRLDPFGYAHMRRVERALPAEYEALVRRALARLDAGNVALVAEVAALPELVRGYEQVKLRNVERFRTRAAELLARLEAPDVATLDVIRVS
ncbi:indolepyruvate ferredoxin oxidoreductase family protein [Conexibacter sp. JD483]|uniref:indolepyruvate ferredoxin oxidoreductase family protein n=1 Tax=unclassified Conexibacter TaxID=2627773 RepID=UPI0027246B10|nr:MULTISPECIES: indolepyruvate ferredoxin oxidoreductase family protein [unclassified Conexibacter]MDO8187558.1 indolepyruvate ferredoxin oxidoreductase family protein [Conexibacter sp. CPCC 205706]MDO8198924.1 indolepyruvate ferredoxin oxidoreductase family protein [Conexibacter sp. CPCC 205762]MDR9372434.1 indolepyruvate ferredoxin oxidoreductase family protein [Conexibacter sp. JD483]